MVINLVYDIDRVTRAAADGHYDAKGLQISASGAWKYPSIMMLIKLLEPILASDELKDIEGNAKITSDPVVNGIGRIRLEIEYKQKNPPSVTGTR